MIPTGTASSNSRREDFLALAIKKRNELTENGAGDDDRPLHFRIDSLDRWINRLVGKPSVLN
jgi:hypothetical protein